MAWARLKRDKVAIVCSVIILFFLLVAIFAPFLVSLEAVDPITGAKADPSTVHTELVDFNGLPTVGASSAHWLGVEPRLGRDLFARWAYGARPSLIIGFVAAFASTIIGVTLGLVGGYLGGASDKVISWIIDFFLSLPILLLVLAIIPIMQKRLAAGGDLTPEETSTIRFWVLIVILVVFGWMGLARLVRGEVKSLREREFVQAARAIGVPTRSILFREILPNLVGPIIVSASIAVPGLHHLRGDAELPRRRSRRAHRVVGSHHRRRAEPLRHVPAVALALGHRPVAARPRPEPARRLDPRRVRPHQPPLTPPGHGHQMFSAKRRDKHKGSKQQCAGPKS